MNFKTEGDEVKMGNNLMFFVSHCVLNTNSKVEYFGEKKHCNEEVSRHEFIKLSLEKNIALVQLPCPEFIMYGSNRWGHTKNQFDNTFFRARCRKLLEPVIIELQEYLNQGDRFKVLGVVGIDGSPSCGVNVTCTGQWGGEMSSRCDLDKVIHSVTRSKEKGVFMEELERIFKEHDIDIPIMALCEANKLIRGLE